MTAQGRFREAHGVAPVTTETIDVVVRNLDVVPRCVRKAAALLSDAEHERAGHFFFERDRRRFVVARSYLRSLLGRRLGVPPESLELQAGPHGKPALSPRFADSDLRFNVSHCEGVAVYAFARGRDIGVDLEALREIPDADDIAAHMFSRAEYEAYSSLPRGERCLGFFNCWTRKEAFIKALGDGLTYPLDRFEVSLIPGQPARILSVDGATADQCNWTLHSFWPGPGLVGAVVVERCLGGLSGRQGADRVRLMRGTSVRVAGASRWACDRVRGPRVVRDRVRPGSGS
jgi:4'-phosphopantetheinyl transferase